MVRVPFKVAGQSVNLVSDLRGGIGNRLIAIGCVPRLAAELNYRPIVFWPATKVVGGAVFGDLFESTNLPFELVGGYEAKIMSFALYEYHRARLWTVRKRSLGLLSRLASLQYDKGITTVGKPNIHNKTFHMMQPSELRAQAATDLLPFRKIGFYAFHLIRYGYDFSWLKPIPQIASRITELKEQFAPNTVGVHLRGTDVRSDPPINEIIARMRAEIDLDPDVKFFFASDGDRCGEAITTLFKDRLIESPKGARGEKTIPGGQTLQRILKSTTRGTLQGQHDAVVDLFGLAATSRIIGGRYSSFVRLATLIGNKPTLLCRAPVSTKKYHEMIRNRGNRVH